MIPAPDSVRSPAVLRPRLRISPPWPGGPSASGSVGARAPRSPPWSSSPSAWLHRSPCCRTWIIPRTPIRAPGHPRRRRPRRPPMSSATSAWRCPCPMDGTGGRISTPTRRDPRCRPPRSICDRSGRRTTTWPPPRAGPWVPTTSSWCSRICRISVPAPDSRPPPPGRMLTETGRSAGRLTFENGGRWLDLRVEIGSSPPPQELVDRANGVLAGLGIEPSETPAPRDGWKTHVNPLNGISIHVPQDWVVRNDLVPALLEPHIVLGAGNYPLSTGGDCGPDNALADLPSDGVLLWILRYDRPDGR